LQQIWRDGVFAEMAHWPASCTTPLRGLDHIPAERLIALAKLVVPYGGLLRAEVEPGQTIIVNGATGYFGSAGVMLAVAMGASKVLALGRDGASLARLASALGPRVAPVVITGDHDTDVAAIQTAAGGKADVALDLVGQAASTNTTLAALRSLRRRGRLVLMGSASVPLPVSFGDMLSNDCEVVGNFMYPKTAPGQLAAMIAAGLLDLSPIRVQSLALSQLPDAIEAAATMRDLDLTAVLPD
jgi:alcohol dehydrogenase